MASLPKGPLRIALFAYPDVQALDVSGPLELFARALHARKQRMELSG